MFAALQRSGIVRIGDRVASTGTCGARVAYSSFERRQLMMNCAGCGFEAAPEFAFCPKCGQRLGAPAQPSRVVVEQPPPAATEAETRDAESDRRPVTVVFADLSGFTALSERLDPEDVRALQTDLFNAMSASIRRFDGFVEKFVGDAVMAVFGAPVAHEDDPERAIHAAIDMQQQVAALSEVWKSRAGQALALHIGINSGPVVAGHLGSARGAAYAVTGDTVNFASRLQSSAGPGQIFVSQSTYQLAQHAFGFESLGALSLKGKAEPMLAYRVDTALSTPRSARGLLAHGLAAPLVGRDADLGALSGAFDRMLTGKTQLVRIVADAGTGKTRLLNEFLSRLSSSGQLAPIAIRRSACSSVGERTFGVPAALLRDAYGVLPDDSADITREKISAALATMGAEEQEIARVSAFLGYVLALSTKDSRANSLDPEQLQRQVFMAVQAIIERRLQGSPLLLIVEDLHWADAASIELLHFLLAQLPERKFMLLATHRPRIELEELGATHAAHTLLRLTPLSGDHSQALLDALFGRSVRSLPVELKAQIVEHAGGNPLFLEEMVRALIDEGVLQQQNDEWVYRPGSTARQVPRSIHGLLLARLDRLSVRARLAIQEAAVVGPSFAENLLREITSDPSSLAPTLDMLAEVGLVSEAAPPTPAGADASASDRQFRFCHGLFHDVSYENLLARRRVELHTRIGEALERRCGARPQHLEELQALGHHFRLSSDKPRGARYLVLAGDWARSIYANADAIRHYQLALETLAGCEGHQGEQLAAHERLGDVLTPVGQSAAATRHLEVARAGYSSAGDRIAEARVMRKIAGLLWEAGDRAGARRYLESGLALIDDGDQHIERAKLYQEMGQLEFRGGDNHNALRWTQRALDHVGGLIANGKVATEQDRREAASALALTLNTQGVALARLDRLEDAVARLERSVTVAREADMPQAECRALSNLGVLYSSRNPKLAIHACERGLQSAIRVGDLGLQSRLYANLAVAYCTLTNRCDEDGIGAANTAIEIDRRAGQLDHLAVSLVVLGQIYQCHGEPALALDYYREAQVLAEKSGEPQLLFPCYDGLATLYLELDDFTQAERYMSLAQTTCQAAGLDPDTLIVLPFLA
jgi:adenylate cyclase